VCLNINGHFFHFPQSTLFTFLFTKNQRHNRRINTLKNHQLFFPYVCSLQSYHF
jgi:hypothetical protein